MQANLPSLDSAQGRGRSQGQVGVYLIIVFSVLVLGALAAAGKAGALRAAIPALSALVAIALCLRRPTAYIRFSLWVWFLAPLVRRLVDFRFGFAEPNYVLLAPLFVAGVGGLSLFRSRVRVPIAFVFCGSAILYGFLAGILQNPNKKEAMFGLVNWLCPLLFGLYLYLKTEHYEEFRDAITRTMLWGVLLLGVYGVCQFFAPPAWDVYWLESVIVDGSGASFGQPAPMQVRVWSTLNAPGPFANVMLTGLLLLFSARWKLKLPAAIAGYAAFLLSIVRTAWLSWIIGLVFILKGAKPKTIVKMILSMLVLIVLLLPFARDARTSPIITDRFKSFQDLQKDNSYRVRAEMYRHVFDAVTSNPFGEGLKNELNVQGYAVDSGILAALLSLGWLGTLLFALGIGSLALSRPVIPHEIREYIQTTHAIMIAILAQLVGSNVFTGVTGAIFWIFAAMSLSARHAAERSLAPEPVQPADLQIGPLAPSVYATIPRH